jgi:hypothetical protein
VTSAADATAIACTRPALRREELVLHALDLGGGHHDHGLAARHHREGAAAALEREHGAIAEAQAGAGERERAGAGGTRKDTVDHDRGPAFPPRHDLATNHDRRLRQRGERQGEDPGGDHGRETGHGAAAPPCRHALRGRSGRRTGPLRPGRLCAEVCMLPCQASMGCGRIPMPSGAPRHREVASSDPSLHRSVPFPACH